MGGDCKLYPLFTLNANLGSVRWPKGGEEFGVTANAHGYEDTGRSTAWETNLKKKLHAGHHKYVGTDEICAGLRKKNRSARSVSASNCLASCVSSDQ